MDSSKLVYERLIEAGAIPPKSHIDRLFRKCIDISDGVSHESEGSDGLLHRTLSPVPIHISSVQGEVSTYSVNEENPSRRSLVILESTVKEYDIPNIFRGLIWNHFTMKSCAHTDIDWNALREIDNPRHHQISIYHVRASMIEQSEVTQLSSYLILRYLLSDLERIPNGISILLPILMAIIDVPWFLAREDETRHLLSRMLLGSNPKDELLIDMLSTEGVHQLDNPILYSIYIEGEPDHDESPQIALRRRHGIISEVKLIHYLNGGAETHENDPFKLSRLTNITKHIALNFLLEEAEIQKLVYVSSAIIMFIDIDFWHYFIEEFHSIMKLYRIAYTTIFASEWSPAISLRHLDHLMIGGPNVQVYYLISYLNDVYSKYSMKKVSTNFDIGQLDDYVAHSTSWNNAYTLMKSIPRSMIDQTINARIHSNRQAVLKTSTEARIRPPVRVADHVTGKLTKNMHCCYYLTSIAYIDADDAIMLYNEDHTKCPIYVDLRTYKDQGYSGHFFKSMRLDIVHDPQWMNLVKERLINIEHDISRPIIVFGLDDRDPLVTDFMKHISENTAVQHICVISGGYAKLHDCLVSYDDKYFLQEHHALSCYLCLPEGTKRIHRPKLDKKRRIQLSTKEKSFEFDMKRIAFTDKIAAISSIEDENIDDTTHLRVDISIAYHGESSDIKTEDLSDDRLEASAKSRNSFMVAGFGKAVWNAFKSAGNSMSRNMNESQSSSTGEQIIYSDDLSEEEIQTEYLPHLSHPSKLSHDRVNAEDHPKDPKLVWYFKYIIKYHKQLIYHTVTYASDIEKRVVLTIPAYCEMLLPMVPMTKNIIKNIGVSSIEPDKLYFVPVWIVVTNYDSMIMVLREKSTTKRRTNAGERVKSREKFPSGSSKLYAFYDVPLKCILKVQKISKSSKRSIDSLRFVFKGSMSSDYHLWAETQRLIPHKFRSLWEVHTLDSSLNDRLINELQKYSTRKKQSKQTKAP